MIGITPDWFTFKRDVGGVPTHLLATHDTTRERHRDAALALVHEDNEEQQGDGDHQDDEELDRTTFAPDRLTARGKTRHDVREDQETHALADAALGDELREPHDEASARGHDDHHEQAHPQVELGDQVDVEAQ